MSYTVLARKYRSRTFDEVIGQEAIARTLKNAVANGRVHHGYLFCGTRGVGKTSMARILAKALNCLAADAPTTDPCGACEACQSIAVGQDLDVIEIDAASNTGVDNIRELRSHAQYRPSRCRFKVYIVDEVHMLSTGAFNALLKTLEEPPSHVKFIFCTTEPHRVPATIQSRCQRFDFRSIPTDQIARQLTSILQAESIDADEALIRRVARLADGSMRDALSLLDQLLSLGQDHLAAELVDEILPRAGDELMAELTSALAGSDAAAALSCTEQCLAAGLGFERFAVSLIDHLRCLMLLRVCGADTELIEVPAGLRQEMVSQCQQFDAAAYVYMIGLLEQLRRNVRFSTCGRALVDAAVVRLAAADNFSSIESLLAELGGVESGAAANDRSRRVTVDKAAKSGAKPSGSARGGAPAANRQRAPAKPAGKQVTRPNGPSGRTDRPAPSSSQIQAALRDPLVQRAIEVFQGRPIDVKRVSRGR